MRINVTPLFGVCSFLSLYVSYLLYTEKYIFGCIALAINGVFFLIMTIADVLYPIKKHDENPPDINGGDHGNILERVNK